MTFFPSIFVHTAVQIVFVGHGHWICTSILKLMAYASMTASLVKIYHVTYRFILLDCMVEWQKTV